MFLPSCTCRLWLLRDASRSLTLHFGSRHIRRGPDGKAHSNATILLPAVGFLAGPAIAGPLTISEFSRSAVLILATDSRKDSPAGSVRRELRDYDDRSKSNRGTPR